MEIAAHPGGWAMESNEFGPLDSEKIRNINNKLALEAKINNGMNG
jgi:hypothetical protein